MYQYLEDLHNSVNQYIPIDVYTRHNIRHGLNYMDFNVTEYKMFICMFLRVQIANNLLWLTTG